MLVYWIRDKCLLDYGEKFEFLNDNVILSVLYTIFIFFFKFCIREIRKLKIVKCFWFF